MTPDEAMERHYAAALDAIYELRQVLVYEARVLEAHLDLAGFPKSRRGIAEQQVKRMRAAARGEATTAYVEVNLTDKARGLLREAGAPETLTRAGWEDSHR